MTLHPEGWNHPQKILILLAHPDDPEFFMGGTVARWAQEGHEIHYCLFTRGDKGANDCRVVPEELARKRVLEQEAAANILRVKSVTFLNYEDGFLYPDLPARKEVTRVIRQFKPDILVSCDPTNLIPSDVSVNHPDHRAAGQLALDGYFPAAGDPLFYPDLIDAGYEPHSVNEIWLSLTAQPNVILDVTPFWPKKIQALHEHRSQIGELEKFDQRMRSRHTPESTDADPKYVEKFRRIIFPKV
jgi:LmbE family N-acetylglucosaminyl deacetylase